MSRIVITGGHHNSALVVAQYFQVQRHQIYWFGHRYSSRGDTNDSAEYLEVKAAKIPFYNLVTGRFILNLRELVLIPIGVIRAYSLLRRLRPKFVLSFGGYLGAAVALAAFLLHIPIYLHEQTVTAGLSNKLVGRFASKIYLTWDASRSNFPAYKTMVVGLPLRSSIIKSSKAKLFSRRRPTLLVMGGKLGAHALNQFVFTHLSELLLNFNLVHQTGTSSLTKDYERALALQATLGSLADSYLPLGYITESEIGKYLTNADYYLGRSGAHICYELIIMQLKAVLVPLATTHDREQYKNAHILSESGQAIIVPQSELDFAHFTQATRALAKQQFKSLTLPTNAAETIYHDIFKI